MIYRIIFVSDEAENFIREISISADATFYDLHKAILACCDYKDDQMTSFFLCSHDWEKEQEITLEDMHKKDFEEDSYVMGEVHLSDVLEDEKQRFLYVFDPLAERVFFMELTEIKKGTLAAPKCTRKEGEAPKQTIDFDELMARSTGLTKEESGLDEDFYGSDSFNEDELDAEGFDTPEDQL
jgi:hypothetical protein